MAKRIEFHPEDLRALNELAEDRASSLQELMDEAVHDLLKKYRRPTSLRDALRKSAEPEHKASSKNAKSQRR